jgi:hypothetical protein
MTYSSLADLLDILPDSPSQQIANLWFEAFQTFCPSELTLKSAHFTQEQATMGATLLPFRKFVLSPL